MEDQKLSFEHGKFEMPLGHPSGEITNGQLDMYLQFRAEVWAEDINLGV